MVSQGLTKMKTQLNPRRTGKRRREEISVSFQVLILNILLEDYAYDKVSGDSVKEEKRKVKELDRAGTPCDGIRIVGLGKTYQRGRCKSKKDIHAVRKVYLEIPNKELFCLLGHNGAGKSTTFSMLTGCINSTRGSATIFGYDIDT